MKPRARVYVWCVRACAASRELDMCVNARVPFATGSRRDDLMISRHINPSRADVFTRTSLSPYYKKMRQVFTGPWGKLRRSLKKATLSGLYLRWKFEISAEKPLCEYDSWGKRWNKMRTENFWRTRSKIFKQRARRAEGRNKIHTFFFEINMIKDT